MVLLDLSFAMLQVRSLLLLFARLLAGTLAAKL